MVTIIKGKLMLTAFYLLDLSQAISSHWLKLFVRSVNNESSKFESQIEKRLERTKSVQFHVNLWEVWGLVSLQCYKQNKLNAHVPKAPCNKRANGDVTHRARRTTLNCCSYEISSFAYEHGACDVSENALYLVAVGRKHSLQRLIACGSGLTRRQVWI